MKGNESRMKGNESKMKGSESKMKGHESKMGTSIGAGIGTGTDGHGYNEIMSNLVVTSQPDALVLAKCNDIRRTVIVLVRLQMLERHRT